MNQMESVSRDRDIVPNKIFQDVVSFLHSHLLLFAVTEFDLFTRLERGDYSVEEVSAMLSLETRPTEHMLLALTAMGYLVKVNGRFSLALLADRFLVRGRPVYLGAYCKHMLSAPNSYENFRQAMLTNTPQNLNQKAKFIEMVNHEKHARDFAELMHALSYYPAMALADLFDFSKYNCLLDIAGGQGSYAVSIAQKHSNLRVMISELPWVCKVAEDFIARNQLSDRIKVVSSDMFKDSFPPGADLILLSQILHDWNREKGLFLLKKAFEYLPRGGAIIVHEILFDDKKTGPMFAVIYSLSMQLVTEGMQYTGEEMHKLLAAAGFKNIRQEKIMEDHWISVAEK